MHELEQCVLHDLEGFILKRERATWFSIYLRSFIYLTILEGDTWNLESWKAKSARWALDPRVAENPVRDAPRVSMTRLWPLQMMKWPLSETPSALIEKNEQQARLIAGHVQAINKGSFPFVRDKSAKVAPNMGKATEEAEEFASSLSADLSALSNSPAPH